MTSPKDILNAIDPDTVAIHPGRFSGQTPDGDVVRIRLDEKIDEPEYDVIKRRSGQFVVCGRAGPDRYLALLKAVLRVDTEDCK